MLYEVDGQPSFRIALYNNSVADKWKHLIESIYVGDGNDIDYYRTFFELRKKDDIRQILLNAIEKINTYLGTDYIKIPEQVDWTKQDIYNELHMKFEKLSGTHDNPTKLMSIAPMEVKESIRDLNYAVHSLEHNKPTVENLSELNIQWTKKRNVTPRIKLTNDEYNLITFEKKKHEVYLSYNELGKNYQALWEDKLPVHYGHAKNNHYIGADIIVSFENKKNIFNDSFIDWCKENKIDWNDKSHGIGLLPIGKIVDYQKRHLTKDSKLNIILERNQKNDKSI